MKKFHFISLIVLTIFLLSGTTYAFPDIRGHWAERVIKEVSTERPDVIGGFPDGTMRPSDTVTREQFIKMLMTGIKAAEFTTSRANFTDVGTRWSRNNIHSAVHLRILEPNEEGIRFRPASPITREDMALYTTRLLGIGLVETENVSLSFSDKDTISERHKMAVSAAVEHGLLAGYPDGTFGPKRSLTRAEAFVVISRILNELKSRENTIQGTEGRAFGNISSYSIAKQYGGWIYYARWEEGAEGLYRMRPDGTNITKLNSDEPGSIYISDGWIYYGNWQNGGRLYRVRIDGSSRAQISNQTATNINVIGERIYFVNHNNNGRIYRIQTNGSGLTRLTEDGAIRFLAISSGFIYYASGNGNLYRIRLDGAEKTTVIRDSKISFINIIEPWIIFSSSRGGIWRARLDGSGLVRIIGKNNIRVNVSNNKMFFISGEEHHQLYSMNLNGTDMRRIVDSVDLKNIVYPWVYYFPLAERTGSPPGPIRRVNVDGTQDRQL